jgi:glucan phosphoethanolaminetransferase (alkaline phosphatase superfamily)
MSKKLLSHLTLALIFFFMTLLQQYLFYFIKNLPIVWLSPGKYLGIFLFFMAATFIRPWGLRYFFLSFIFVINLFQMSHLSYFGTQILPSEIWLLLSEFHEIQGTLLVELEHLLIPLILTLTPALIGLYMIKKSQDLWGHHLMGLVFILYFLYNPVRTYVTGNTWGRQPSTRELSGMNVYLSFSYFAGKILPHKIFNSHYSAKPNTSLKLKLSHGAPSVWENVILVLGESLSPHQMSLFGYNKPSTPFLLSELKNPHFFATKSLSGGVSTDISVAFLMNMGFGEAGALKASKAEHCLIKLAKKKSFTTHFLSAQSSQQLRYIAPYLCSSFLDDYRSLNEIAPTMNDLSADDKVLLPELEKILHLNSKQFIILHQRGSHAPWEARSLEKNRRFPHTSKVNHYDNSVVEFDLFMKELSLILEKSGEKTLVIYLSDHGEALGQAGLWGHGRLDRPSFEVPILIWGHHQGLNPSTQKIPHYVPHYNATLYLAEELGYKPDQNFWILPNDYTIYGNDIDGFAGKAHILFQTSGTYNFKVSL